MTFPIWKNKIHVPNHQPDWYSLIGDFQGFSHDLPAPTVRWCHMVPCLGSGDHGHLQGNRQLILAMDEAWLGTSSGSDLWGSMGALWGVYMGHIGAVWGVYTRCISIYHDIMIYSDESILIALYFANQLTQQHTGNAKLEANWAFEISGIESDS